VHGFETNFT
jgi:hypothetical protein